jgi:hypothetical protein
MEELVGSFVIASLALFSAQVLELLRSRYRRARVDGGQSPIPMARKSPLPRRNTRNRNNEWRSRARQ